MNDKHELKIIGGIMKNLTKSINLNLVLLVAFTLVIFLIPDPVYAAKAKSQLKKIIDSKFFAGAIDLGLIIFAAYQWFLYIADFNPGDAFKKIILPALVTFLAFQWKDVLKWINLY